jgi:hypothetical protein
MRARCLGIAAFILSAVPAVSVVTADEVDPICALILHEERGDLEDWKLAVDLAESRLVAAESIFKLVDALWKEELIERFVHLTAKHALDVAVIDVKRHALLLKRQEAFTEQLAIICSPPGNNENNARREAAHRRYLQADCHRIGKDLAIAEVDLIYNNEYLANVRDLRENGVATAQQVILAEEGVENARRQVKHHAPRVKACIDSGAAAGNGSQ